MPLPTRTALVAKPQSGATHGPTPGPFEGPTPSVSPSPIPPFFPRPFDGGPTTPHGSPINFRSTGGILVSSPRTVASTGSLGSRSRRTTSGGASWTAVNRGGIPLVAGSSEPSPP